MEKLVEQVMNYAKYVSSVKSWNWPEDWLLKLLSLLFAIFLWYFVVGEDKVDINVVIPLEIVNLPHDLVISNQYKKELDVTVSGARGLIRGLARQNLRRTVDLSGAEPGAMVIHNTPEAISLPRGIRVLRIQPTNVVLQLDRLIQKTIAIKPVLIGQPPNGFHLDAVTVKPDSIMITGPQAVLADINSLSTDALDLRQMTASQERQIRLELPPAIAELLGETVVTAQVSIKKTLEKKTIPGIPLTLVNQRDTLGYYWEQATVTATAGVPTTLLKENSNIGGLITAEADVGNLDIGRHAVDIVVKASSGIVVQEAAPQKIQVEISRLISPAKAKNKR